MLNNIGKLDISVWKEPGINRYIQYKEIKYEKNTSFNHVDN
jgi:hypothetical protein